MKKKNPIYVYQTHHSMPLSCAIHKPPDQVIPSHMGNVEESLNNSTKVFPSQMAGTILPAWKQVPSELS